MNESRIKKLLAASRQENPPAASANFVDGVLRAVHRAVPASAVGSISIFDRLNVLFPRCAWAAVAVIVIGIAADFGLTAAGVPELGDGVAQVSAQWLFTGSGF